MTRKIALVIAVCLVIIAFNTTVMQYYETVEYYHIDALLPGS